MKLVVSEGIPRALLDIHIY